MNACVSIIIGAIALPIVVSLILATVVGFVFVGLNIASLFLGEISPGELVVISLISTISAVGAIAALLQSIFGD